MKRRNPSLYDAEMTRQPDVPRKPAPDAIWCLYPQEHDTARELKGQVKYLRATPVREHASELLEALETAKQRIHGCASIDRETENWICVEIDRVIAKCKAKAALADSQDPPEK